MFHSQYDSHNHLLKKFYIIQNGFLAIIEFTKLLQSTNLATLELC